MAFTVWRIITLSSIALSSISAEIAQDACDVASGNCAVDEPVEEDMKVAMLQAKITAHRNEEARESAAFKDTSDTGKASSNNPRYTVYGAGYCCADEASGHRIGSWVYGGSTEMAEKSCTDNSKCRGFHWSDRDKSYVLVDKVGPTLGPLTAAQDVCYQAPQYRLIGNGYCSDDETDGHRIGSWIYGQTQNDAMKKCDQDWKCKGYHWSARDNSYVLVDKAGPVGPWTEARDQCYAK